MKYLKKFNKINEDLDYDISEESINAVREILNSIESEHFIELGNKDYYLFETVKGGESWTSFDEKFLKKKLDRLQINYFWKIYYSKDDDYDSYGRRRKLKKSLPIEEYPNVTLEFNNVDGNFLDSLVIKKCDNDWFLIKLMMNNDDEFFLCNELDGVIHFIMEKLFQFCNNEQFLAKLFDEKFELVENYLKRNIEINNSELNKFNFYKNETLGKVLISHYTTSLYQKENIIQFLTDNNINSISNLYFLLEKGIITKEQMQQQYPNTLTIDDGILLMVFEGELSDLAFMFDDSSKNFVEEIQNMDRNYSNLSNFRDLYLGNLTKKALDCILVKIEELKKNMDEEELAEFDDYETWEEQVENIDALSELKDAIRYAYYDAQESANSDEGYKAVVDPIETFFRMDNIIYKTINDIYSILIRINKDWLIKFDTFEDSTQYLSTGKFSNRTKTLTDDILEEYFKEKDYNNDIIEPKQARLKVDFPYYGWDGHIDEGYLEDIIEDKVGDVS